MLREIKMRIFQVRMLHLRLGGGSHLMNVIYVLTGCRPLARSCIVSTWFREIKMRILQVRMLHIGLDGGWHLMDVIYVLTGKVIG
jgi:hypothetical protein